MLGIGSAAYTRIFTSSEDSFNSVQPRPRAPTQLLRTFNVPDTRATHVRLVMRDSQCIDQEQYEGERDNDLLNDTDYNGSDRATIGHAAELQVFG
jgi:hypothetical protein